MTVVRKVVFISKATPEDDEFVLWLAPRLEMAGYDVFADILALEPGDNWRGKITDTLQFSAAKMLLCGRPSTVRKEGVMGEIAIAKKLSKTLKDPRFIIPLRLEDFNMIGVGELQHVDFKYSWAAGLSELLSTLARQKVPCTNRIAINPNWERYLKRQSVNIVELAEPLVSNWLRISELPETIYRYNYRLQKSKDDSCVSSKNWSYPIKYANGGVYSFDEGILHKHISGSWTRMSIASEHRLKKFFSDGEAHVRPMEARNIVISLLYESWAKWCRKQNLLEYNYASASGFHAPSALEVGKYVNWGGPEGSRSMIKNIIKGKVWQYGVSAWPYYWPFPHFKLKTRVLFSNGNNVILPIAQQHSHRRSLCKGWRNKRWYGHFRAFLCHISKGENFIKIPLSPSRVLEVSSIPITLSSPISIQRKPASAVVEGDDKGT